jgi:periplasmic copper chaperone A
MNALRICAGLLFLGLSQAASAHEFKAGDLVISHPWTRATPEGASVGVAYLKITNNGKTADRFTGGTFDGAEKVEIHEMKMTGEKMTMRRLPDGLMVKPGETVELTPESYHLMLRGLTKPIAQGPNIKGTLTFEKAGSVDVDYKVEAPGASTSADHMHHEMHQEQK